MYHDEHGRMPLSGFLESFQMSTAKTVAEVVSLAEKLNIHGLRSELVWQMFHLDGRLTFQTKRRYTDSMSISEVKVRRNVGSAAHGPDKTAWPLAMLRLG